MKPDVDSSTEELELVALSLHNALRGMPVIAKARGKACILVEDGRPVAVRGECSALDRVFSGEKVQRVRIGEGRHTGTTMFVSAIIDCRGRRVGAIGVIDTLGVLSLGEIVEASDLIERQLFLRRPRK